MRKFIVTALLALVGIILFSGCSKQMSPMASESLTKASASISPDLLPGKCPYVCTDTRCEGYENGYCGADTTVNLVDQADSNANTAGILSGAYNELSSSVNWSELSTEMGITITASTIDFTGALLAYDANNQGTFNKVLTANFYQNSQNGTTLYAFTWIADSASLAYGQPFMVKVVLGQYFTLYDLTYGYEYTVTNYNTSSYTITEKQGSYILNAGQLEIGRITPDLAQNCTGQNVVSCLDDAYNHHGWVSVWLWVQTAYLPATAAVMAASCAAINCIPHKD